MRVMTHHVICEKKVFTEEKEKFKKYELSPSCSQTTKTMTTGLWLRRPWLTPGWRVHLQHTPFNSVSFPSVGLSLHRLDLPQTIFLHSISMLQIWCVLQWLKKVLHVATLFCCLFSSTLLITFHRIFV